VQQTDPWAAFNPQPAPTAQQSPFGNRPVIHSPPAEPKEPKTTYRPLTSAEVQQHGLPPGSYQLGSDGKIDKIGDNKTDEAADKQRQNAAALLRAAGVDLERGIDPIAPLITGSTSGKLQHIGAEAYALSGHATPGMENIGKLKTIVSDMVLQLTGGGLGNQVSDADREFIIERVGNLADPNVPADQRLASWEAVKQRMGNILGVQDRGAAPQAQMPQDRVEAATGGTKEVVDPNLTPVRREYLARLQAGQSGSQLVAFLRSAGVTDPGLLRTAAEQAAFRRKNPNTPVGQYNTSAIDHITQQMSAVNRGLNAAGQSGLGAGALAAGNAVSGGYLPEIVGATGGNTEQARLAVQQSAQDHPGAALTGGIIGGTTAALGGEAALARGAGMAPGFGRSLVADSGYGAVAGSGASPDDRLSGAALGAGMGAVGSAGGQAIAKAGGAALSGVRNADVGAMVGSDVPLTVGQAAGGRLKGIEDKLASFIPGIATRRSEGVRAFNTKAFDKALEPIGGNVGGKTGSEAVATARDAVSAAFNRALQGKAAVPDEPFVAQAKTALGRLAAIRRNDLGMEIVSQIEESTKDLFDPSTGALTGENMQTFLESMRQIRQAYKGDPLYARVINPAVKQIERATEGMFERQAPEVMPAYNSAKAAYRRVSVLADAVNAGENTNGIFMPSQLGNVARANAKKYDGPMSAAANRSDLREYQRSAQNVLPNKYPDSGTAGRLAMLAVPSAIAGSGAGVGYAAGDPGTGSQVGLGLAGMLAMLYTKRGQSFLVNAMTKRNPGAVTAGEGLKRLAPALGASGAALTTGDQ
jgi:hypothetical protein